MTIIAKAIKERLAEHGYAMSWDTAKDLAGAVIDVLPNPCGNDDCVANCRTCVDFYDKVGEA